MKQRQRRQHTPEQKAALVRKHVVDRVPPSQICEENDLQPSVFYDWLRRFYESAERVFAENPQLQQRREHELEERIAKLEAKLARKDGVIAEISSEYVALKKTLGDP